MLVLTTTHKKHFNTVDCSSTETNPYTPKKAENKTASEHKKCMGYGACSVSGCPCKGFAETYGSDLCNNCGHKYTDHW